MLRARRRRRTRRSMRTSFKSSLGGLPARDSSARPPALASIRACSSGLAALVPRRTSVKEILLPGRQIGDPSIAEASDRNRGWSPARRRSTQWPCRRSRVSGSHSTASTTADAVAALDLAARARVHLPVRVLFARLPDHRIERPQGHPAGGRIPPGGPGGVRRQGDLVFADAVLARLLRFPAYCRHARRPPAGAGEGDASVRAAGADEPGKRTEE